MTEEREQQERFSEEKANKTTQRRLFIYIVVGVIVSCLLCYIVYIFVPRSSGEPPVPGHLPADVTPSAVHEPVEAPTEVPFVVEYEEASIFPELVPRAEILANSIKNIKGLFDNPDFQDDAWYEEVSDNMSILLVTVREMEDESVPVNCEVCKEVHNELVEMAGQANKSNIYWHKWVENPSEKAYLESMLSHFSEFQSASKRAIDLIKINIDEE